MPTVAESVREIVEPLLVACGLDLFDLEYGGGRLVITVDCVSGADVGAISSATRTISRALDAHDAVPGHYTLEVSSPGLERALRTPEHFTWAVGRAVAVKLLPGVDGDRRMTGTIESFDAEASSLRVRLDGAAGELREVALTDIDKARTVFAWGAADRPVSPSRAIASSKKKAAAFSHDESDEKRASAQ